MKRAHGFARGFAHGFVLLPAVIALALLAAICFQLAHESGFGARLAGSGVQADSARFAAEAGLARIHAQVQASYCNGYIDFPTTGFASDSFTATVSPKSGSPVTLTATGTTASGASTTLTRANVVARQGTPYTMTLQPGPAGKDTYLEDQGSDKNYGGENRISIDAGAKYPLLHFDLSSIPPGSLIQNAAISLYVSSGFVIGSQTVTAYPMTRDWVEGTGSGSGGSQNGATWRKYDGSAAWTTAGGDYDAAAGVSTPAQLSLGWTSFDVLPIVAAWTSGRAPNYGVLLKPSSGLGSLRFVSGDDSSNPSRWPKLIVTFVPPCNWLALAPVADGWLNQDHDNKANGSCAALKLSALGGKRARPIYRFDLSSLAPGTMLQSATLRLYVSSVSNPRAETLRVYRVTESWAEGATCDQVNDGAAWLLRNATQNWTAGGGGSFATPEAATLAVGASFDAGWIEFDVRALAQAWVDGASPNHGLLVTSSSGADNTLSLSSREAASNPPQLVLTYQ